MSLLSLAAQACNVFGAAEDGALRIVQKVKDDQARDVVSALDQRLHAMAATYVADCMPGCRLLSEEGVAPTDGLAALAKGEWLVVDPLDGSNNYVLTLPGYGFMAAHLVDGVIAGSVVVLPEHDLYMVSERGDLLVSQPFAPASAAASAPIYYAYPPHLTDAGRAARAELLDLVDRRSAGLYRYGSACIGAYNLLRGRHGAFIGHSVRVWDALAYFPLLHRFRLAAKYHLGASGLTLIAGFDETFVDEACTIISANEAITFNSVSDDSKLVISK
ncbi:inositol monophosphatase family protein [Mycolicibacterium tusciae]|uniref:inositol monophosphatase family protein n=1 Tax=Mycolicibacterium tusciae TaxID=75922 RepID=UPI00024A4409|nr:inositol monophosphatase family protein [Mycolicibacterium tusciae]